ncbi:Os06g0729800, partial [Oryza sativa Japonica Group]
IGSQGHRGSDLYCSLLLSLFFLPPLFPPGNYPAAVFGDVTIGNFSLFLSEKYRYLFCKCYTKSVFNFGIQ